MTNKISRRSVCALLALTALPFSAPEARAQREHLTPEEIEQVRENQALDLRMGVFVKAVERRLQAVSNPQAAKQSAKDVEKWGTLEGTRAQMLADVADILDEAITNIEDAGLHSDKSPLIPKALRVLAARADGFLTQLKAVSASAESEAEREALDRAAESLGQVMSAAGKLPPEEAKEAKKAKKKN